MRAVLVYVSRLSILTIIIASVIQLVFLYRDTDGPKAFLGWIFILIVQFIQTVGIVSACGPYLKPLIDNISSGMINNNDILRRTKLSSATDSDNGYVARLRKTLPSKQTFLSTSRPTNGSAVESELASMQGRPNVTSSTEVQATDEWDAGSYGSRTNIIRQTLTYEVDRSLQH
ncbi:MAG: hypothetical protein Q9227_009212 [Pyrenula ochraceoflavens]